MKRLAGIAGVAFAVAMLSFSVSAAADHHFATGDFGARINLLEHCGTLDDPATMEYPANTAFFVRHGWGETPWQHAASGVKQAMMSPTSYFEFRIDRVPQPSALHAFYVEDQDLFLKTYVTEVHDGMTGTHRFGGLWFLDGSYPGVGGGFGEPVFQGGCVVIVTFV